ncbi:hypothetical protein [uncultured Kordia sp.]|uniref:hypothetical protein n=1 Tax=uncultured Kordia sp. TaxID=507699 RepID=UPI0026166F6B|nr:hypothetical protein [uncultured Kordia sp.]
MKNHLFLACLALTMCFISCSNDDEIPVEPEESFYGLRVGNSWVYQHFRRENSQSEIFNDTGVIDSVQITGTEIINGNEFFKYRIRTSGNENNIAFCSPNGERFEYLRDSLGFLVNEFGKVQFSTESTEEFRYNNSDSFFMYTARGEENEIIATPAGEFDSEYMKVYARPQPGEVPHPGLDKYYYVQGVGKVFNTLSFISTTIHTMERRLISYDVQ